jgi:predicted metal-binding membrane protein
MRNGTKTVGAAAAGATDKTRPPDGGAIADAGLRLPMVQGADSDPMTVEERTSSLTSPRTHGKRAVLTAMLAFVAASWLIAVARMDGMDMGVATELGSFASFAALWVPMMAAMMLPSAVPAVSSLIRSDGRVLSAPFFAGSYLAVWTAVGLVVYALYEPHGTAIAGALIVAAGVYELTPLKRESRRRCRERVRSGFVFGVYCVGSSIGLMVMLLALGVMSVAWMCVVAALILAQKLVPLRALVDVPLALTIVAFGFLVLVEPSAVPGLTPTM